MLWLCRGASVRAFMIGAAFTGIYTVLQYKFDEWFGTDPQKFPPSMEDASYWSCVGITAMVFSMIEIGCLYW